MCPCVFCWVWLVAVSPKRVSLAQKGDGVGLGLWEILMLKRRNGLREQASKGSRFGFFSCVTPLASNVQLVIEKNCYHAQGNASRSISLYFLLTMN